MSKIKTLRKRLGMNPRECADYLGLASLDEFTKAEENKSISGSNIWSSLAMLDSIVESAVISAVDQFCLSNEKEFILIRFLTYEEFALYEPEMCDDFGSVKIHRNFIDRTKKAIERIDGKVIIAFMNSEFYEAWLGVNDFDDNRELRVVWARQQLRGLIK